MIGAGVVFCLLMAAAPEREKLVVLEVTSGDESTKRTARLVEEQLLTELTRVKRFEVLGQNEIAAALGFERQRKLLGCAEDQGSCLSEIGGALGAKWLLMASLGRFGSKLRLDMKVVDTSSGKAAAREGRVLDRDDELFPTVTQLTAALVSAITPAGASPAPVAHPSLAWFIGGGAAAIMGVPSMVLGSAWGEDLNRNHATVSLTEAQSRMGLFQVMYWGGVVFVVGAAALIAGGVWAALRPAEPAKSAAPVALHLTPSGLEVRW